MVNEAMWPVASPCPGADRITIAMPKHRAALDALFNKNVSAECHDETVNAAWDCQALPSSHGAMSQATGMPTGCQNQPSSKILALSGLTCSAPWK
jgi:hypothetical protein